MEEYCNYQLSMLLKEKGFNELCEADYFGPDSTSVSIGLPKSNEYYVNGRCCAPSLAQAMKWLREKHKMSICVGVKCWEPANGEIDGWLAHIWFTPSNNKGICCYWAYPKGKDECFKTYEEAVEAAIFYCLDELFMKK